MEFRILGPLDVVDAGRSLDLGGQKQRALLTYLLLHRHEPVSTDRLVTELWVEPAPPTAAKVVQVYVSRLRRLLGERTIERRASGYVLDVVPDQVDADRFERLVDGATHSEASQAARTLREALALWRGPALADLGDEPFAAAESRRLEERRLHALEERIEADLALGRHAELVAELDALVVEHPLRERPRGQLMLALYRSGRQADALAAYRELAQALREQLGLAPSPALRRLEQRILTQDPMLELAEETAAEQGGFVGRERELGRLLNRLARAFQGEGSVFLVSGEPGVGKTRLAEELSARARRRGALVLVGRCWEAGGAPSYWPWVQALRGCRTARGGPRLPAQLGGGAGWIAALVPELTELVGTRQGAAGADFEGGRFRLFQAVVTLLGAVAADDPVLLVLEDLHAADPPSLLLLEFLAAQLADMRVLVVATHRDVDPPLGEPLSRTLAELRRQPVVRSLPLAGLDREAVARMIELRTGRAPDERDVAAIHGRTEGNPLFVGELVRLLDAPGEEPAIPEGVRTTIRRRLGRLPEECRSLLSLAAVLGREFELAALELMATRPAAELLPALQPALAARLVIEIRGGYGRPVRLRFSHALVREVLYDELPPARRVELHREAGESLERLYATDPEPHLAELAHHFAEAAIAGDRAKALDYTRRAGDRSAALLAYEEAARLFNAALRLLGAEGREQSVTGCELLLELGDALARSGDESAAKRTFLQAAAAARALGAPPLLARAALGYGGRFLWARAGSDRELVDLLREALAAIGNEPSIARVRLLGRLAGALRDQHEREERDALSREAVDAARQLGDHATLSYALDARITAILWPENAPQRLELADELLLIAARVGDRERLLQAHYSRLFALLDLGDLAQVHSELEVVAALARELRQPAHLWFAVVTDATLALFEGRFVEAERLIDEAAALGERAQRSDAVLSRRVQLFTLGWQRGDLDGLESMLRQSLADYPARPMFRCMLTLLQAELGDESSARRELDALAADRFGALPLTNEWLFSMGFLAEAAARIRHGDAAATIHELLLPHSALNASTADYIATGSVARPLGLAATAIGDRGPAAAHLEDALEANARMGAVPWTARTQLDLAVALMERRTWGDLERARTLLGACVPVLRGLGMRLCVERAESLEARVLRGRPTKPV
jgi:DNA-binding SARP family transcriptional activator